MKKGFLVPIESDRAAVIKPLDLGKFGRKFLEEEFAQDISLSSEISKHFDEDDKFFAPLEVTETLSQAIHFRTGNSRPTEAIKKWLIDFINSKWENNFRLVIADPWAKPEDIKKYPPKLKYFLTNTNVYYLPEADNLYSALKLAKRESNFLFFGFIISPETILPENGTLLDEYSIQRLASNTKLAFSRAYDWEGYVVWKKDS